MLWRLWRPWPRPPGCYKLTSPLMTMPKKSQKNARSSTQFRYFTSYVGLTLKSSYLTQKSFLLDCQNFKFLHPNWWFWEASDVLICPESSGKLPQKWISVWYFCTSLNEPFFFFAVFTYSWRIHPTDAGHRLSFPGHISFPVIFTGFRAPTSPSQPSSRLPYQGLIQTTFNLSLLLSHYYHRGLKWKMFDFHKILFWKNLDKYSPKLWLEIR